MFSQPTFVERVKSAEEVRIYEQLQATVPMRDGETEPQRRWRLEQAAQDEYEREQFLAQRRNQRIVMPAEKYQAELAAKAAEEAATKQRRADELAAQARRQQAEVDAQRKRQDEAKAVRFAPASRSITDEEAAAIRARNAANRTHTICATCDQAVKLLPDGSLPQSHEIVTTDEDQFRVKRICYTQTGIRTGF